MKLKRKHIKDIQFKRFSVNRREFEKNKQIGNKKDAEVFEQKLMTEMEMTFVELEKNKIFLPKSNEQIRIISNRMPADAFLFAIAQKEKIKHIDIIIYSMIKKSIAKIKNLNVPVDFVVSHAWTKLQQDNWNYLNKKFPDAKIIVARNHAKIFLVKTKNGNHYVCEGSGNFSRNTNLEQYLFENNKQAYDFHKHWIKNLENGNKEN